MRKNWSNEEVEFLKDFYPIMRGYELEKVLDRTKKSIKKKASKFKLKSEFKGINDNCIQYFLDEEFFSVPNILNSYWAGFIAADGTIRGNCLIFRLKRSDENQLIAFKKELKLTNNIVRGKSFDIRTNSFNYYSIINFSSKKIIKDLKNNFNIENNKSNREKFPKLSKQNLKAFIVGYIDGDGYIGIKKYSTARELVVCGSKKFLEQLLKFLKEKLKLETSAKVRKPKQYNIHTLGIHNRSIFKVLKALKMIDVPKLSRKWDKI